jgi:uncharacterized protein HemX
MTNETVLIGATEVVSQYDGSGIFNPTGSAPETASEVEASSYKPTEVETAPEESTKDTASTSNNGILLYGALALAAYFFFFKKK